MASCDHKYQFTLYDIGAYGSEHNGSVLQLSSFGYAIYAISMAKF